MTLSKKKPDSNDEDFGEVQDVSNGYVFVQKGITRKNFLFLKRR
jgi:hypothetical protein